MIEVGAQFPEFSLQDQTGATKTLQDFSGKWIVLYFYPKDNTPGCTIEGIGFSKRAGDFEELGAVVIGVSKDTVKSHQSFCEKQDLRLTLLSDPERSLYASAKVPTKKFMGATTFKRSTYIIDPKGAVAHVIEDVTPIGHAEECLAFITKAKQP